MPINLKTKSVYYKTPRKFIPIGKYSYDTYSHKSMGIEDAEIGQVVIVDEVDSEGKPISYESKPYFYHMEISVESNGRQLLNGVGATVRYETPDGPIYYEAVQENGMPMELAIPTGFVYYVEVYDPDRLCLSLPQPLEGIITDHDEFLILRCSTELRIETAQDIKDALNDGIDLSDYVGESITCSRGDETLTWDIVDYDPGTIGVTMPKVTLMLHEALDNMIFEPAQALMYCEDGLAAGAYQYRLGENVRRYFTLTVPIPAGGQLKADDQSFQTYSSQDATTALETGYVSSTSIADAIDLGTTGNGLLNDRYRITYGSNNFAESALFWWLNTDAPANTLRVPVTKFSRAYSYNQPGFLNNLDPVFVSVLDNTKWLCSTNSEYECPKTLGGYTEGINSDYTITSKIGLASKLELLDSNNNDKIFDLYNDAAAIDRIKYRRNTAQTWWLRSSYTTSTKECCIGTTGYIEYNFTGTITNYAYAVVPVCCISADKVT